MHIGSIVRLGDVHWRVVGYSRLMKTCHLANFESKLEVAEDTLEVLYNPPQDWPFATPSVVPSNKSPIVKILRSTAELRPFIDWVPSDFHRQGPVFFNPGLKLRKGEVLTAVCLNNVNIRIVITQAFGTASKKIAKMKTKEASDKGKPKDIWDDLI